MLRPIVDDARTVDVEPLTIVGGDVELLVEERVAVGYAGLPALLVMGPAEAAGMGKLETDDEVIDRTPACEVLGLQDADEFGDTGLVRLVDN